MATRHSKTKTGANAVGVAAMILIGVVLVNIIAYRKFFRIDLTQEHVYTLSPGSKELVAKLPDKLTIKAFISSNLQPPATQIAQYTRDLLDEYANSSQGKLKWEAIAPDKDPKGEEEAKKANLPKVANGRMDEEGAAFANSYFGLVISYQGKNEVIATIPGTEGLEFEIDKRIRNLTQKKAKLAFASSEGELSTEMGPQGQGGGLSIAKRMLPFFEVVPVQLSQGQKPIPDDAVALIIAGPKQPFSDRAKFVIDQFLMKGKSVAFFVDGMILDSPQQMQIPGQETPPKIGRKNDTGLDDLLDSYGFKIHDDIVLEPQKNVPRAVPAGERLVPRKSPAFLMTDTIAKSSPLMERLPALVLPFTSSVELIKDKQKGLLITELATSSGQSWRQKGFFLYNLDLPPKPTDEKGPFALAYAAEGKFKSFFAGKPYPNEKGEKVPPPEKNASLAPGVEAPIEQAEVPGRLLIVASSSFISDETLMQSQYFRAYEIGLSFFLNAVDWLAQDKQLSSIRSKSMTARPITVASRSTPNMIKAINVVGVPLLFIAFGFLLRMLRNARRARARL
jgi:ABC-2 type transport system permease protein